MEFPSPGSLQLKALAALALFVNSARNRSDLDVGRQAVLLLELPASARECRQRKGAEILIAAVMHGPTDPRLERARSFDRVLKRVGASW